MSVPFSSEKILCMGAQRLGAAFSYAVSTAYQCDVVSMPQKHTNS
jgi:hypothetical protein